MLKSLGLIETIGLTTGITAADAAVKSANIKVVGYEFAKGSGRTVIKIEGDVGAVKAAVEAASVAAASIGSVAATKVIARPSDELESMIRNRDTVGYCIEKKDEKLELKPKIESKLENVVKEKTVADEVDSKKDLEIGQVVKTVEEPKVVENHQTLDTEKSNTVEVTKIEQKKNNVKSSKQKNKNS